MESEGPVPGDAEGPYRAPTRARASARSAARFRQVVASQLVTSLAVIVGVVMVGFGVVQLVGDDAENFASVRSARTTGSQAPTTSLSAGTESDRGEDDSSWISQILFASAAGSAAGPEGAAAPSVVAPDDTIKIENAAFLLGDSVMVGASPYVGEAFGNWSVTLDARVGRFLDEGLAVVRSKRSSIKNVAVIHLGNNYGGNEAAFRVTAESLMTALAQVDLVVWVTVAEDRPNQPEVNATIRSIVAAHPNAALLDWTAEWAAHREYTAGDHLHLSPLGAKVFASFLGRGVTLLALSRGFVPVGVRLPPALTTAGQIPKVAGAAPTPTATSTTVDPAGSGSTTAGSDPGTSSTAISGDAGTATPNTSGPSEPATTVPATTVPATTAPVTTAPAATVPAETPPTIATPAPAG